MSASETMSSFAAATEESAQEAFTLLLYLIIGTLLTVLSSRTISKHAADESSGLTAFTLERKISRSRFAASTATAGSLSIILASAIAVICVAAGLSIGLPAADLPRLLGLFLPWPLLALAIYWVSLAAYFALPRAATPLSIFLIVTGTFVELLGRLFDWPTRITGFSPWHHLMVSEGNNAPWGYTIALALEAITLALIASIRFSRRDIVTQ